MSSRKKVNFPIPHDWDSTYEGPTIDIWYTIPIYVALISCIMLVYCAILTCRTHGKAGNQPGNKRTLTFRIPRTRFFV